MEHVLMQHLTAFCTVGTAFCHSPAPPDAACVAQHSQKLHVRPDCSSDIHNHVDKRHVLHARLSYAKCALVGRRMPVAPVHNDDDDDAQ